MQDIQTQFQSIFAQLKKGHKQDFYLFMILKMDEYVDKWSIAISAPWITKENFQQGFKEIADIITKTLTSEQISTVARIGIFQPNEHLIKVITRSVRIRGGSPVKFENTKINGYKIHLAYIFESNPPED